MELQQEIIAIIKQQSYITLEHMMELALCKSAHAYYKCTKNIGDDFITAPEISQMFGEMIALWIITKWQHHIQILPIKDFNLVELGPGSGKLMSDILRTLKKIAPDTFSAIRQIALLEINPNFIASQKANLSSFGIEISHIDDLSKLDTKSPNIIIANEFFDALPIKQYIKKNHSWQQVVVRYNQELYFDSIPSVPAPSAYNFPQHIHAKQGAILEVSSFAADAMGQICRLITSANGCASGAALIIDYGYCIEPKYRATKQYTSTLQGVKEHQFYPLLQNLGQVDLTTHVDFYALKQIAEQKFSQNVITQSQKQFLQQMGIELRLAQLIKQNPRLIQTLTQQYTRLMQMDFIVQQVVAG